MIEVFVAVHGEPLQAALPGTSVHDRSGRSSGIRPRCLHRCLHLVPPILKPAFAWHRPKESNGCLFTRSAHTTSTLAQGRSPWRHERSHRTTISLRPSSTPVDGDCALLRPLPEGSRNSSTRLDQPQQARRGLLVVALSFLYRLVRRVFEAARVHRLDAAAKDAEILVLRHQLAVLRRQVDCPRFTWSDRAFVALFACLVPRECWRSFLVTPQTILGWHRTLVKKRWTYPHRGPGHPSLPEETVNLICRLARENPRWGYLRIVGELKKIGVTVSKTSVASVLRRHGFPPAPRRMAPTWSQFLSTQAKGIVATDFFHVDTVLLHRYYVLFIIEVQSRVVHVLGATTNPNGAWVTQVARNFASDVDDAGRSFRFLIRDRDTKFMGSFDEVFTSIGIESIRTPVRSPRGHAYAERFVRTIRQECLDHLLVVSRRHLDQVLAEYVRHYNEARPHRGLQLSQPIARPATAIGAEAITHRDVPGGIIHEYDRAPCPHVARHPQKRHGASETKYSALGQQAGSTARAGQAIPLTRNPPSLLHTSTEMAPLRVFGPFRPIGTHWFPDRAQRRQACLRRVQGHTAGGRWADRPLAGPLAPVRPMAPPWFPDRARRRQACLRRVQGHTAGGRWADRPLAGPLAHRAGL